MSDPLRSQVRLDTDRRRRLRGRRAAGRADLVSLQRLSDRQGHLRLPGHGSEGHHRGGQRHAGRSRIEHRHGHTFVWSEGSPMATYLATVTSGRFRVTQSKSTGSRRTWPWIRAGAGRRRRCRGSRHPRSVRLGLRRLSVRGHRSHRRPRAAVGYALETQTRPLFTRRRAPRSSPTSWRISGSATT